MKPILFNTKMVRALLAGRKTVTRRVVKPQPQVRPVPREEGCYIYRGIPCGLDGMTNLAPYRPGDIMYVRETWNRLLGDWIYKADQKPGMKNPGKWRPSIHMPREAARIFLRVTDVRVERLQDITEEQAEREGCEAYMEEFEESGYWEPATLDFIDTWNSTIKPADRAVYGWDANPYVWRIEFERCEKPKEKVEPC